MARLMLLDSASLYFRAFYGLPDSLRAADGTAVNAVRGLLDFVSTLVPRYAPDAVVACWDDDWRPRWRVDLLPSYKTHRLAGSAEAGGAIAEEVPDALSPQVPIIAEALGLAGIDVVGAPEAEADDIIGSFAAAADGPVDIVTGDRDLFQLVDDDAAVRVLYTARGVQRHDVVDAAWIRAKYGIEPGQYVDFAALRGDASDGIPGVPGIGEKTAAALLGRYGTLDGVVAAAEDDGSDVTPRARRNLLEARDYLEVARQVITVRPDACPTDVRPRTPLGDDQRRALAEFGERWNLGGVTGRLVAALG